MVRTEEEKVQVMSVHVKIQERISLAYISSYYVPAFIVLRETAINIYFFVFDYNFTQLNKFMYSALPSMV